MKAQVRRIAEWAELNALPLEGDPASGAVYSPCGRYRYLLWRDADERRKFLGIGMLNPSTADHCRNDPTIARCRRIARGHGRPLLAWNLFAFRATFPADLKAAEEPVGPHNCAAIELALGLAHLTVAAWGIHGRHRDRETEVLQIAQGARLHVFRLTRGGCPAHPLYLPASLRPSPWDRPNMAGEA